MGEQTEKPLSRELIEGGMRADIAHLCHSIIVRVALRARKAAYIDEILGDMATLHHFKDDLLMYVRFGGQVDTALKILMMAGYMRFDQNTAEYVVTQRGRERMAMYLP